jgi:beta-lactam-binding protein with PASTA domain
MKTAVKKILVHLGVMALLGILLLIGVTNWLDKYTHHSSAIHVPPLTDLTMEQAIPLLEELGLRYEIVDSMHISGKPAGVILEQKPSANAKVKIGRIVFITLNKAIEESMAVPYVIDFSQRQAIASLEGAGFVVNEIRFVPSEFRNLVIDLRYRGESIEAGTTLPVGSSLSLIVGQGRSSGYVMVPGLTVLPLDSAILTARLSGLNIGEVIYDVTPQNEQQARSYFVYRQEPLENDYLQAGSRIKVWMTQDSSLLLKPEEFLPAEAFYN